MSWESTCYRNREFYKCGISMRKAKKMCSAVKKYVSKFNTWKLCLSTSLMQK